MKFLIVIRCPNTGQEVPTGVVTDAHVLDGIPTDETDVLCSPCGRRHTWSVHDAFLAQTPLRGDSDDFRAAVKIRLLLAVRVESDPIFVRDGSVWTSAGVTAGIDLALALVEEDLGRTVALAVARYLVVFLKRPGGQAQFSEALSMQSAEDESGALHDWINQHLPDDLSLAKLAHQAGMSERSFSRHYVEVTGVTPARAIERLRVEAARRLLSETRLPVKRISQRCGFGSEETMRRSFLSVLSATPNDYRARFSS
jgi:AraC-like DNA-binding protein